MKQVYWFSRHEMSAPQKADLEKFLGHEVNIVTQNVTWDASEDAYADDQNNKRRWKEILDTTEDEVIVTGVFPPVALESLGGLISTEGVGQRVILLSPVSKQDRKIREDGSAQIEFIHLRWATVMEGELDYI
jgi:hypothetical protein